MGELVVESVGYDLRVVLYFVIKGEGSVRGVCVVFALKVVQSFPEFLGVCFVVPGVIKVFLPKFCSVGLDKFVYVSVEGVNVRVLWVGFSKIVSGLYFGSNVGG